MKILLYLCSFLLSSNIAYSAENLKVKSIHYNIESNYGDKISNSSYTEYYNVTGKIDSVYRYCPWLGSENLSEKRFYLPNGKMDYIIYYDYEDIVGQILNIEECFYNRKDTINNGRFDSIMKVTDKTFVFDSNDLIEYKKFNKFDYVTYTNFWVIEKYEEGYLVEEIDLMKRNSTTTYTYNSFGFVSTKRIYIPLLSYEEFDGSFPDFYQFNYTYNNYENWITCKMFDEDELAVETITRTIVYF